MSFVASKLAWLLANPANLLLLLLCASLALLLTPWKRLGRRLGTAALVLLLLVATLPLDVLLLEPLENRFPPPERLPERVDGIVLLGGSYRLKVSEARGQPALNAAADRVTAFLALARRYPEARLAFSGGSGSLNPGKLREADVTARLFAGLGFDPARLLLDRKARNTYENALNLRAMVRPAPGEIWLLVTSAYHMPRAVGTFRQLGWPVTAYPVDYRTTGEAWLLPRFDLVDGLNVLSFASREWIGLAYYWISGHSGALFPASDGPGES